jgi:hypothetical protein
MPDSYSAAVTHLYDRVRRFNATGCDTSEIDDPSFLALVLTTRDRNSFEADADQAERELEESRERERDAIAAMQVIMEVEGRSGYLSGPKRIAEVAVDQAVVFLRRLGHLTDEQLQSLEARGSIGDEVRAALAGQEQDQ